MNTIMADDDRSNTAKILSNRRRVAIIEILAVEPCNVTSITERTGMAQAEVSMHLSRLLSAGLVESQRHGKEVVYRLIPEPLEMYSNWLDRLASAKVSKGSSKYGESNSHASLDFSFARTCYDHLAGKYGVELLKTLLDRRWLIIKDPAKPIYDITDEGIAGLQQLGISLPPRKASGRKFAYGCRDVSERDFHLGGLLGSIILNNLIVRGIVFVNPNTRILSANAPLTRWFGT